MDQALRLIATVNAHLRQVEAAASHGADEATMQMVTGSLRLLLCEGNLARAWYASRIGGPIVLNVWSIAQTHDRQVLAFCGGGDVLPGVPFSVCLNATLQERNLNLGDFCRQMRVQIGLERFRTVDIIEFVANALGGSHYDPNGRTAKKAGTLSRLAAGAIDGLPLEVNGRSLLHHEVLSIGQAVIRSRQVAELRRWRPAA